MAANSKKRATKATTIGAVLGIVALLAALGTVAAVNLNFQLADNIVSGTLAGFDTLFSSEDTDDWHTNQPYLRESGCVVSNDIDLAGDFTDPAVRGTGLGYVFATPLLTNCVIDTNSFRFRTNATIGTIMALNPKAFAVGLANDFAGNTSFKISFGLVNPGLGPGFTVTALPAQSNLVITENQELLIPLDAGFVAFAALLPTWSLGFNIFEFSSDDMGPAGTIWNLDLNVYGNASNTSVAFSLFDAVRPDQVFITMFGVVAGIGWLAAVWIWPGNMIGGNPKKGGAT